MNNATQTTIKNLEGTLAKPMLDNKVRAAIEKRLQAVKDGKPISKY
jgi:hypothetical protein|tara:strand:- start:6125 stop:6262 length:138 start_codon:yes stop_codon:yes gene_type:complete